MVVPYEEVVPYSTEEFAARLVAQSTWNPLTVAAVACTLETLNVLVVATNAEQPVRIKERMARTRWACEEKRICANFSGTRCNWSEDEKEFSGEV